MYVGCFVRARNKAGRTVASLLHETLHCLGCLTLISGGNYICLCSNLYVFNFT